jgi:hypothetical protein
METAKTILFWALLAVAVAPAVLGVGWGIAEHEILSRRIPREHIERMAAKIAARHPEGSGSFSKCGRRNYLSWRAHAGFSE